jgi:hypothetical protein
MALPELTREECEVTFTSRTYWCMHALAWGACMTRRSNAFFFPQVFPVSVEAISYLYTHTQFVITTVCTSSCFVSN